MSRRRTAVLDWDGSLCNGFTILAWARYLNQVGVMHESGWKAVATAFQDFDRGRIDYTTLAHRAVTGYAHGLTGRRVDEVAPHAAGFARSHKDQVMWFAPQLIRGLRAAEVETFVITGSPQIAVSALAKPLGIDHVIGLKPFVSRGQLTSLVPANTALPEVKQQTVDAVAGEVVLGLGNSAGDEALLAAAHVRIFVGDGAAPQLEGITRIPTTPSAQAQRALAGAIAAATKFEVDEHEPRQRGEVLET